MWGGVATRRGAPIGGCDRKGGVTSRNRAVIGGCDRKGAWLHKGPEKWAWPKMGAWRHDGGALIGGCDRRGVASRRGTSNGEAGVANRVGVATRRRTLIGVAKGAWLYECVANRGRGYMKGSADWWRCYEQAWLRGRACPMGAFREVGVAARGGAGLHGGER